MAQPANTTKWAKQNLLSNFMLLLHFNFTLFTFLPILPFLLFNFYLLLSNLNQKYLKKPFFKD